MLFVKVNFNCVTYMHIFPFYSVHDPKSFTNVTSRWIPEIRHFCPDAAVVLVATKTDDSYTVDTESNQEAPITAKQGRQLTKRINVILLNINNY